MFDFLIEISLKNRYKKNNTFLLGRKFDRKFYRKFGRKFGRKFWQKSAENSLENSVENELKTDRKRIENDIKCMKNNQNVKNIFEKPSKT